MMRRESGFTLIEIIITILLIGIVAAMAALNFAGTTKPYQVTAAKQTMLQELRRARSEALARNTNVELLQVSTGVYAVQLVSGSVILGRQFGISNQSGAVTVNFNNLNGNKVQFNRLGSITNITSSPATILISNTQASKSITLYPTGFISK